MRGNISILVLGLDLLHSNLVLMLFSDDHNVFSYKDFSNSLFIFFSPI